MATARPLPSARRSGRAGKPRSIDVEDLWRLARIDRPSLSPDGAQAVVAVNEWDMEANRGHGALWLLSTLGGAPRRLTRCGEKDGQPAFSPHGDLIAFTARRNQPGDDGAMVKDAEAQLYLIAPDGGEAWCPAKLATGVEAFRWCPDGRHIVLLSWLFPASGKSAGKDVAKAQAKALAEQKARKTSGIATSDSFYRWWDRMLPEGRVPGLLLLDTKKGALRDLLGPHGLELKRSDPDTSCFDLSPDGRHLVFEFDPAHDKRSDGRFALAELNLKNGKLEVLAQDPSWDYAAPRYSPDGRTIACIACDRSQPLPPSQRIALLERGQAVEVVSGTWDHDVHAPLHWEDDGQAILCTAEQAGRQHLWRFDLPDRRAEVLAEGGWVSAFDKAAGVLVTLTDSADHPAQVHATLPGAAPRRIETFNDALMKGLALGRHETITITGAQGDPVQVWLHYPPGFDPKRKHPLLHVIHGGPHTAFGDQWHYRWNLKAFAAQGYVVAAVNYHGSSGFGQAFAQSISSRLGELELQDVEAATDALLKRPWADPKRVFASGGSYGGFMVAWMNGKLPAGRYAAYVCHAGCFDWVAMFADDAWAWHAKELGAWYWDDPARLAAQNPMHLMATMTTPTLVVHGALDYRVPDAQGLAYYNSLKARGIPARLLWYPDENHWVLKPRNSRQWYVEFFAWLAAHDPGQGRKRRGPRSAT